MFCVRPEQKGGHIGPPLREYPTKNGWFVGADLCVCPVSPYLLVNANG